MRVVFDTSVLVAAMVEQHPVHARAFPWLKRARVQEFEACVTTHTLAELYAVLTTLPVRPRITPGTTRRLIRENIEAAMRIIPITRADYQHMLNRMTELELNGGVVYDAIVAQVAERLEADKLLTFNPEDFRRTWPDGSAVVHEP